MNDSTPINCPRCGASLATDAPEGLCPRCLAALPLGPETALTDEPRAAAQPPLTPEQLAPHFPQLEILACLGRGGMGVVYKARQKSLNRLVALKLLAPERAGDAAFAERFTREAHALAALNHSHIVAIHDFGQAGGFYFLLMEFVDGVNLRQAMKAARFTPEQALAMVPPVCEALQYAHEHGIVHRDIKPENLLLDKDARVKIADFGIAKMLGEDSATGLAESQPAGTPQYMAPEQKEHRRTDHRADIYSLGVVLYEMLTGELPAEKLQPPSRKVQIDVRLDEIVLRALEKTPELRYQTAAEMRTQVETIVQAPKTAAANTAPEREAHTSPATNKPDNSAQPNPTAKSPWRRLIFGVIIAVLVLPVLGFLGLVVIGGSFAMWNTAQKPVAMQEPPPETVTMQPATKVAGDGNSGQEAVVNAEPDGEAAGFGPVIERDIPFGKVCLKMDTGNFLPIPELADGQDVRKVQAQLYFAAIQSSHDQITAVDLPLLELADADWTRLSAAGLKEKFAQEAARKIHAMRSEAMIPRGVYGFSSYWGSGLLQVVGSTGPNPGSINAVKVRYKLTKAAQVSSVPPTTPPATPAPVSPLAVRAWKGDIENSIHALGTVDTPTADGTPKLPGPGEPGMVIFQIPETDTQSVVTSLRAKKPLVVEARSADGKKLMGTGEVVSVDSAIDQATGTLRCQARVTPQADTLLYPGQFLTIRLLLETKRGVTLTLASALHQAPGGSMVYVLDADGLVAIREVTPGMTEHGYVEIVKGLETGEIVVTDPHANLVAGDTVMYELRPISQLEKARQEAEAAP